MHASLSEITAISESSHDEIAQAREDLCGELQSRPLQPADGQVAIAGLLPAAMLCIELTARS